jgi:REP-associated tyrosine transposase
MIPKREHARNCEQTYFVTSSTWERRPLFRTQTFAELFVAVLGHYRGSSYLLHEFVLMPDHFHLLITPDEVLERAVQKIKGGFSFRVKKELGSNAEIWQRGFSDHRIRDWEDYRQHREYIYLNPARAGSAGMRRSIRTVRIVAAGTLSLSG